MKISYNEQIRGKAEEKQRLTNKNDVDYGTLLSKDRDWRSTRIELVMFVFIVAKELSDQVVTNLLESRACRVTLQLSVSNCSEPLSPAVEDLVQPGTASVVTARYLVESFLPSFLALVVGPWSDRRGRKPFLTVGIAGYALSYLIWAVLSVLPGVSPPVFLVASTPIVVTGGFYSIHTLCYCYISDVTGIRDRANRLALMCLVFKTSAIVSSACAPVLLSVQNSPNPFPLVFFLSSIVLFFVVVYIHFCLRETVDVYSNSECRSIIFTSIKDTLSTCLARQANHGRTVLLLLVWTLAIALSISAGEEVITYLYVREMFSWQLSDYAVFQCYESVLAGLGTMVGVIVLVNWLGFTNVKASILVSALRCLRSVIMALATDGSMLYLASTINVFYYALSPFCRSELSLLVPSDDSGKVFSFLAFHESMVPLLFTPLYSLVYQGSFLYYPGAIFWLSAGLILVYISMLLIALHLQRGLTSR